jgi:pimeloyl-ACP methyl ester carboxylesterase
VTDLVACDGPTAVPEAVLPESVLPESVLVDGARVRYAVSGGTAGRGDLLLVHGRGAHHLWWYRMLPLLERNWRVIRLDLSGHGDSDHRPQYSAAQWSAELLAVLDAAGSARPVLVGHSMGGVVCLRTAVEHAARLGGLIMLDSRVRPPGRYREQLGSLSPPGGRSGGRPRYAATREELVRRFRLTPAQPPCDDEVMGALARHAARLTPDGWIWKHDPRPSSTATDADIDRWLHRLSFPAGYVYGTESQVTDRESAEYLGRVVDGSRVEALPGAHHHVILEQPARCAELVDEMAGVQLRRASHEGA